MKERINYLEQKCLGIKTAEIREKKNGNKRLWENINELRGKEGKRDRELKVYDREGVQLEG